MVHHKFAKVAVIASKLDKWNVRGSYDAIASSVSGSFVSLFSLTILLFQIGFLLTYSVAWFSNFTAIGIRLAYRIG